MRSRDGFGSASRIPAQVTSFVDRERELAEILWLLAQPETRLVSLTGPGGVGKTHLALRAAAALALDGAGLELYWLSLAPMERAGQLSHAIGEAFELKGSDSGSLSQRLAVALLERRVLLLLDNFEHLQDATPLIGELLDVCPTLTLLVTSRGSLHLSAERELALEPLVVPSENERFEEMATAPAVQLFLQRAPARFETEPPSQEQLRAISAICRRLDGLPLAIELAAAWCRLLTPAQLLTRLDRRLPMLTDGPVDSPVRLQTMRDAIAWSFALLRPHEQELFGALCIFAGGFTLEAAEYVARSRSDPTRYETEDPGPTIKGLAQLVNRGLVRAPDDGRFTILQTIREFGLETLTQSGELDQVRRAHLAWCTSLVGEPDYEPLDGYIWSVSVLAGEQAELSAALAYALETEDTMDALKLAAGLAPIWAEQGRYAEARSTLNRVARGSPTLDAAVRAIVIGWEAEWAWLQGDYSATWNLASEALDSCRLLKMEAGVAANLYRLGRVATLADPPAARPLLEEALAHYRSTGEGRASCWCQLALGHAALANGERETAERWFAGARETLLTFEDGPGAWLSLSCALAEAQLALIAGNDVRASELLRHALAESRAQRNLFYESLALMLSCQTSLRQQDVAAAASAGREGLQIAQQLGSLLRQWQCLEQLAGVAMTANQPERASLLHGAADALGERLQGIRPIGAVTPGTEAHAGPDGVIDAQQHAALVRTGRRMTDAETLAEVLALERDISRRQEATTQLSKRELDVLSLLAKGETNSAIADRLILSPRTVDTHVGSILRKLQVTSRLDAIEVATERGLLTWNEP